jgi:hypothetical protein
MKVTEHIITDLLPAYLSGEASEDTVKLVKKYFAEHPDFSSEIESINFTEPKINQLEKSTDFSLLHRTKKMMKTKSIFMSIAIFFSALPFASTFVIDSANESTFVWAYESNPEVASLFIAIAVTFWMLFIRINKKLNVIGM